MGFLASIFLLRLYAFSVAVSCVWAKAKHELPRNVTDAFRVFEMHEYGFAIYDQDLDGDLDCLVAKRTAFDKDARTATYIFESGGPDSTDKQTSTWSFKGGETPDELITTLDGDEDHPFISRFPYTDYETCAIMEAPFHGRQECILWAPKEVKINVPQSCMDQFQDICDLSGLIFDERCYEDDV